MLATSAGSALPAALVVGRTLSTPASSSTSTPSPSYFVGEVQNNQVTITYTVYNEQADPETGVLLTTTLEPGVSIVSDMQSPDQSGQSLAWSLGTIQGFERASVSLTVSLPNATTLQLDTGAHAYATLDAGHVSAATPAATLTAGTVDPTLLASTPDANTTDPFIQEEAAKLDYDPTQIFNFLHTQIGYNSYLGSVRGARGALWSSAGNALDVASLGVALMRASGIPAQYAQGTLSQSLSQQLILSMFPASYQTVGYVPAGTTTSDPANDPQLLTETESHYWFQFNTGSGMKDADPLMTGATIGQTFTASTGTFAVVAQSLRATTEVQLQAELYSQASALFGLGDGLSTSTVIDRTFNDVDLVGRPLTVGNFVSTSGGGFIITLTTNTYTPYINMGDEAYPDASHDEVVTGTPYQEVLTNFPFGTQLLTGLFLNMTLSGPGAGSQTFSQTLVDRIGYAAREGLAAPENLSVSPSAPPIISPFDLTTVNLQPGLQSAAAAQLAQEEVTQRQATISQVSAPTNEEETAFLVALARSEVTNFAVGSDRESANLARGFSVAAYSDVPRITTFSSRVMTTNNTATISYSIDLVRDSIRAVAAPGQNVQASLAFGAARGVFDSFLEDQALPSGGQDMSAAAIVEQSMNQGIPLAFITAGNISLLQTLNLPADALARITTNVENGLAVIVPTRAITVNGAPTTAWFNYNPKTGETISESQTGGHQSLLEYALAFSIGFATGVAIITIIDSFRNNGNIPAWEKAAKAGSLGFLAAVSGLLVIPFALEGLILLEALALIEGIAWSIDGVLTSIDPPLRPVYAGLNVPYPTTPGDSAQIQAVEGAHLAPGQVGGTVQAISAAASGSLTASWASGSTSSFLASSLSASGATVVDSQGKTVGTGTAAFSTATDTSLAISGTTQYSITGQGSTSFYGPAETSLGVSGDWSNYTATVTGNDSITVTTAALTVNGQALPAGTYTIKTSSATLSGSGATSSPNFAGSASINVTNGTINLGTGSGTLSVGGKPLNPADETTLDGYSGTFSVSAKGDGTDAVTLNGNAGNVLQVLGSPATLTTDQNTPITFQSDVQTSFADTYTLTANAPPGWTLTIDASGKVTATPAPGLQSGTYPIQLIAQSTKNAALVAQTTVNVTITPTQPGIIVSVAPDSLTTVPFNGAQLPTSFHATIQNLGPTADTYNLSFANVPSGFTLVNSGTSVTVPAGQTAIVGLYLIPSGQIPAQGTQLSFNVTATSTTNPAITKTHTETLTVPAIDAVSLSASPTAVGATPGTSATTTLTLVNSGNVPETVTLAAAVPAGVTASGLATMTIQPGQSATETLTLTPAATATLNSTLTTTITATFGSSATPQTTTASVDLTVRSAQVVALQNAANAAKGGPDSQLATNLSDLTEALVQLQTAPSNPAALSRVQFLLGNVNTLLQTDPALAGLGTQLLPVIAAASAGDVAGLLAQSTTFFNALSPVLTQEADQQFTLAMTPTQVDLEPGVGKTFSVQVSNTGPDQETIDLGVGTLPAKVNAVLGQSQVTLAPGASTTVALTLSDTLVSAKLFNLQVTGAETLVHHSATSMVSIEPAEADVLGVTVSPSTPASGVPVSVSAEVFNTANASRNVVAKVDLLDVSGKLVSTPEQVPVSLVPGTGDVAVNLGQVATTGLANGLYYLRVSLLATDGTAVPGQTSQTAFEIGQPVTATVSASQSIVPPGTSKVTTTISVTNTTTSTLTPPTSASFGDIQVFYSANNPFGVANNLDGAIFVVENTSPQAITGGVLSINPPGGTPDSFKVGTVPAGGHVIIEPGISSDGGTGHTFFKVTGTLLDESDSGPSGDGTPFEFTGTSGRYGIDTGIFTPAATKGPSESDSTHLLNFLGGPGDNDAPALDFQSKIVANLTGTSGGMTSQTSPISVEVGYADNLRANPFFPSPWDGAPNTVFDGYHSTANGAYDSGAIRVINTSGKSITVSKVTVSRPDGVVYQLWGSDVVPAGDSLILTQPGPAQNFDSSDYGTLPFPQTYPDGETAHASKIDITVNGVPLPTFLDTGHVLTTGGSDLAAGGSNESQNWRPVGTTGVTNPGGLSALVTLTHNLPASGYTVDSTTITPTPTTSSSSQVVWSDVPILPVGDSGPATFHLTGTVTNMVPGEVRQISTGTSIAASIALATGQQLNTTIMLAPVTVAAEHIINLTPPVQTADLGTTASYTVALTDPLTTPVTYTLASEGLGDFAPSLATTVTVNPGKTVTTSLTLTVPPAEAAGTYGFTISATTAQGALDSVQGQLTVLPQVVLPTQAVNVQLSPSQASAGVGTPATYVLTVTNVGDVTDTYNLTLAGTFPAGSHASFSSMSPGFTPASATSDATLTVPPGESNSRQFTLTITPPLGASAAKIPFSVSATSTTAAAVTSSARGSLNVLPDGVGVTLSPSSGPSGTRFVATVTNTGKVAETYSVALAGPAALVATLGTNTVTLAPGASQSVPISTGVVNFADPGNLPLMAMATSTTNPAVKAAATSGLAIPSTNGFTSQISPPLQTLAKPAPVSFNLTVNNTGNTEDEYQAVIAGTKGPVTASLVGLDGSSTQAISLFRLPGLSAGAILLNATLSSAGTGIVIVQVKSLTTGKFINMLATVTSAGVVATTTSLSVSPLHTGSTGPVTLTAVVAATTTGVPTGLVTFTIDGVVAQPPVRLTLVNGHEQATLTIPSLTVGSHTFQATYAGISTFSPSVSPVVGLDVNLLPPSSDPRVTNVWRMGYHYAPTTLILGFNVPLNPTSADNTNAYTIIAPDGHRIAILSAVYDAASETVTLHPSERLDLHKTYRLTVSGTGTTALLDSAGTPLDGLGNSHPGSNFVTTVTMANWTLVLPPPLLAADPPAAPVKWTPTLDTKTSAHPSGALTLVKAATVKPKVIPQRVQLVRR